MCKQCFFCKLNEVQDEAVLKQVTFIDNTNPIIPNVKRKEYVCEDCLDSKVVAKCSSCNTYAAGYEDYFNYELYGDVFCSDDCHSSGNGVYHFHSCEYGVKAC